MRPATPRASAPPRALLFAALMALGTALPGRAVADDAVLDGVQEAMPAAEPPDSAASRAPVARSMGDDETQSEPAPSGDDGGSSEPPPDEGGFFDTAPVQLTVAQVAEKKRLKRGRAMRTVHPVFAYTSLGLMAAAEVIGTINAVQRTRGDGTVPEGALITHRVLMGATTGMYYGTGILVWTAPKGMKTRASAAPVAGVRRHADSSKIHAGLSIGHGICMGAQLVTGFFMANLARGQEYEPLLVGHMVSGFAALGLMTASAVVISFY